MGHLIVVLVDAGAELNSVTDSSMTPLGLLIQKKNDGGYGLDEVIEYMSR